jgi:predicted restriction endonuclease
MTRDYTGHGNVLIEFFPTKGAVSQLYTRFSRVLHILQKLSHLNIARVKDAAPHKPLLLLCLLEIAAEGGLSQEIMPITGEFAFRFAGFWSVVAHRRPQRPGIKLPLFHMKTDGFWQPLDARHNVLKYRDLPAHQHLAWHRSHKSLGS